MAVPGYYGPPEWPESSQADLGLILSITGLIFLVLGCACGGPLGVGALLLTVPGAYLGHDDLKAIQQGRRDPSKSGSATAAKIIGIAGTVICVVLIAIFVLAVVGFVFAGSEGWFETELD